MQRIPVETTRTSYDVVVETGSLRRAAAYLTPLIGERRLFICADPGAWRHHGAALDAGLDGLDYTRLDMQPGEEHKRLAQVEQLADRMHAAGADRGCCVVAFGGGITGDVAGFLAASYMRGVDVIQVPTTLLAQVDAAIGGKTGVNLAGGKNLIGAFHQPRLVLIDPATLGTLPEREYRAGLYEVIKYGIIWSQSLFDLLTARQDDVLRRDPQVLASIIAESVRIKAEVVRKDERESDLRRILNYGHTLGHALEAETAYRLLLHGESVAYGMVAAGHLAEKAGLLSIDDRKKMEETILRYGPIPGLSGISAANLAARLRGDKKTIAGRVHFVLAERIGQVRVLSGLQESIIQSAAESALETFARAAAPVRAPQPVVPE